MTRRLPIVLAAGLAALALAVPSRAQTLAPTQWPEIEAAARGQTVRFDAWGGSENVNEYLRWTAGEVQRLYGVTLTHVKIDDAATAVSRILSEKTAGTTKNGSVDLIWINGENFAAMKQNDLLAEPFATKLPNWPLVDVENQPTVITDFTVPTEGRESPWGGAKLVFFADTARSGPVDAMPKSAAALLDWAKAHPGRFTYPAPPDFMGTTFLKQVLFETADDPSVLSQPADKADFDAVTAPLWRYLDALKPVSWREGRDYPDTYSALKQLLVDGEIDIAFAFNPAEASAAIKAGEMPDTVRSFVFEGGTLGNTHFVAIPFNTGAKPAAMVVANFLISPEAQLRKEDPAYWGDPTVLALSKLAPDIRARFEALDRGPATLSGQDLGLTIPEPHPSWVTRLETEWTKRYGS